MYITTEETLVLHMNAKEAGVLLDLVTRVTGNPDTLGLIVARHLTETLDAACIARLPAFEPDATIEANPTARTNLEYA